MKVCKYCNSLAYDSDRKCRSCGASDFAYKCENCGTVTDSRICPSCGYKVGPGSVTCPSCGQRYVAASCPRCGYPATRSGGNGGEGNAPKPEDTKQKTGIGTILLWIFFLPVMLLITVWKTKKLAVVWKVLITCLVLAFEFLPNILVPYSGSAQSTPESESVTASIEADLKQSKQAVPGDSVLGMAYDTTYENVRAYQDMGGSVFILGIVEVENTGSSQLSFSGGSMDFEDEAGNLLSAEKMVSAYPSILLPGEKGYLYCQSYYENAIPESIKMVARLKIEATNAECVRLKTTDVGIQDKTYGGVTILGRVENTTDETQSFFQVAAVLYDETDTPIAVIPDLISEEVQPGEKIGFELQSFFLPEDVTAEKVSCVVVYAYPAWSFEKSVEQQSK